MSAPRVLACGASAVLVDCGGLEEATRWAGRLRVPGAVDVVPAARTVLVTCAEPAGLAGLRAAVGRVLAGGEGRGDSGDGAGDGAGREAGEEVVLDVAYDGPDLAAVAGVAGCGVDELVRRHTATRWRAVFGGFAPGFAYLVADSEGGPGAEGAGGSGLPVVPRLDSPRPSVPAGSVALADRYCGVYPAPSPGGWQLIGTTGARLWDPGAWAAGRSPALVGPGTRVRFRAVARVGEAAGVASAAAAAASSSPPSPPSSLPSPLPVGGGTGPGLAVLAAGPGVVVQDRGRPGWAHVGVTGSGAADRGAAALANRCVGNHPDAAVLEVLLGGLTVRALRPLVCAVTGAPVSLELTTATGVRRLAPAPEVVTLAAGTTLRLGRTARGARAVLAVRGGVDVPGELGSRSRDTLAGLGPPPLRAGDVLGVGEAADGPWADGWVAGSGAGGGVPDVRELRVIPGPRDDWFTAGAWAVLARPAVVGAHSDRVGVRLETDGPVPRARRGELPSEPMVRGSVQVPADGRPVIFGADHPVTGGYPVIGVLDPASADVAAQLLPGDRVRLLRA